MQVIKEWKEIDQMPIDTHDLHASNRVMRTQHTCFGVLIGSQTSCHSINDGTIRGAQLSQL